MSESFDTPPTAAETEAAGFDTPPTVEEQGFDAPPTEAEQQAAGFEAPPTAEEMGAAPAGNPSLVAAFQTQSDITPDTYAQAFAAGSMTGIDPNWLAEDPKSIKAAQEEAQFQENIKHLDRAPKLRAMLARNTALAALARDDVPQLSAIEAGVMDVAHAYYARKAMAGYDATDRLHDIDRMLALYDKEEHGILAETARFVPTALGFGIAGVGGALAAGPAVAGAVAGSATAAVAGLATGSAAAGGALAGPFILAYQMGKGELYKRIQDRELAHAEKDPAYQPLTQKEMAEFAKKGATFSATLQTALGNVFTRSLPFVNGALQRLGVNIAAEAVEDTIVKAGVRRLVETGGHTLAGVLAVAGQAVGDDVTVQKATAGTVDVREATQAGVAAFKHAFGPTLILSALGPGRAFYDDIGRIREAPVEVGNLDRMADMVRSSKSATRAREEMKDILRETFEGTDSDTVYVNHEALQDIDVAQAVADSVGEHVVAEAQATKGDVPMPTEDYLVDIAPEHHKTIREYVRMSERGYTLRQAAEANPDPAAALESLPEADRASVEALVKPREKPAPSLPPESALDSMAREATESKRLGDMRPGLHRRSAETNAKRAIELGAKSTVEAVEGEPQTPGRALNRLQTIAETERARDFAKAKEKAESAALKEADKHRGFLMDMTKKSAREELGKAGGGHLEAMDMLLSGFDFGQNTPRTEVARRQGLMQWLASEQAAGRSPGVPESIMGKLDRFNHWKDLTPQELRDLADGARSIYRQAELKNTLKTTRGRVDFVEMKAKAIARAQTTMKPIPIFQAGDVVPFKERKAAVARGFQGGILKAEEIIRRLDGGDINGPWAEAYWHPLSEDFNRSLILGEKWLKPLKEAVERIPKETRRKWKGETFEIGGRERTMEQALGVAMNQGNASNAFKLLEGLRDVEALGIPNWTRATVDEFLSHVNREGWDAAQAIGDSLETAWPEIAAHEKNYRGIEPPKVKPKGFDLWFDKDGNTVPAGTDGAQKVHYRGWYYPIFYERQFNFLSLKSGRAEGDLLSSNYRSATTPQSRLQSRVENYARPIDLTLNGLPGVVRDFAKDVAMRESLESVHRFITDPDIVNTLHQTVGEADTRALQSVVLDAANDMVLPANGAEAFLRMANRVRGGVNASIFAWNVAQTTQNLAGVTQVMRYVPKAYVREAMRAMILDPTGTIDFARAASGEMKTRASHINADMTEAHRSIQNESVLVSHLETALMPAKEVARVGLEVFAATDAFVAHLGWRSAYEHAIAPKEKGGLGLDHASAVRQSDRTVRLAISSGRIIDLPAFLRHPVLKLIAPFSGWSSTQFNNYLAGRYDREKLREQGLYGEARRKWMWDHAWIAAGGIAGSLLVFKGPKDTDKNGMDLGDVARWLAIEGALAQYWQAPFVGSPLKKLAEGEPLHGSLFTPTIGRPIETAIKGAIKIRSKAEKKPLVAEDYEKFGLDLLESIATVEGLPVTQVKNTAGYLLDPNSPKNNALQIGLGVAAGKSRPGKLLELAK